MNQLQNAPTTTDAAQVSQEEGVAQSPDELLLEARISKLVDAAPPLSTETMERLRHLLGGPIPHE
jgi:hypothetical protein